MSEIQLGTVSATSPLTITSDTDPTPMIVVYNNAGTLAVGARVLWTNVARQIAILGPAQRLT
jgi:hypothetical protein